MKGIYKKLLLVGFPLVFGTPLYAQGYQAINGSAYSGSTAIFNNPASSVHSAYQWDITLFSAQVKNSTNAFFLKNFSLGNQQNAYLTMKDGYSSKFEHAIADVSLFNFLYKFDNNHAFTVNVRGRSYTHAKSLPLNYVDSTVNSFNSFLVANRNTAYLEAFSTHLGWIETDLNYSQVISESNHHKLSGGITLQIMKGISGAFVKSNKFSYLEAKNSLDTSYTITNGNLAFAYSDNYDQTDNVKDFITTAKTSLGISLGIEYLIYNSERNSNELNNNLNYNWKIGISIMDIGSNVFKPSVYAGNFFNPNPAKTDTQIDSAFSGAADIRAFRDSLNTFFINNTNITDNFSINNPTRLNINIDKNFGNNFFVNGELNLNFYSTSSYTKLRTRELNLLTITPRWETLGFGAYLPVQYNTQGQLWVGAALKLGPLVIGIHNFGILKKDPTINGGGYLLFSIHPFNKRKVMSKLDCLE